jgi:glycosyltransferase involved in cell wall biosynthesis
VIPVLIVPILNQPELLDAMLGSIDHPVDRVVIIDNGDVLDEGWLTWHPQYRVIQPGHNLGVAASWNLGMKVTPQAPWWLIVNHDITFGPGDLARLEETVNPAAATIYFMLGMASFAITRYTVNAVGVFDENFAPAYNEDLDFARRLDLLALPRVEVGFSGTHVGSATIHSDPALRAQNGATHMANDAYYARKWGGHKQGGETFSTPFNRGGHVGDWRLDPERLRHQTWRKGARA